MDLPGGWWGIPREVGRQGQKEGHAEAEGKGWRNSTRERVQAIRDKEDRDTWRQGKGLRDIECGSDREPQKDPTRNTVTETGRDRDTGKARPEIPRETET